MCGGTITSIPELFFDEGTFWYNGHIVPIEPLLYKMLKVYVRRINCTVTRDSLWTHIYGHLLDGGPDPKIFDVQVSKIRKCFRHYNLPFELISVWGHGWVLRRKKDSR